MDLEEVPVNAFLLPAAGSRQIQSKQASFAPALPTAFTKEDLVNEFQKLGESLQRSITEHMDDMRMELTNTVHTAHRQHRKSSHDHNGEASEKPSESFREAFRGAKHDSADRVGLYESSGPRERHDSAGREAFAAGMAGLGKSKSTDDEPMDAPFLHKGFLAKKVYNEMAAECGLKSTNSGSHERLTVNMRASAARGNSPPPAPEERNPPRLLLESDSQIIETEDDDDNDITEIKDCAPTNEAGTKKSINQMAWAERPSANTQEGIGKNRDLRGLGVQARMNGGSDPLMHRSSLKMGAQLSIHASSMTRRCLVALQKLAQDIVGRAVFDTFTGAAIFLYSFAIGFQTDWVARNVEKEPPQVFTVIEIVFCLLFTLELGVRIAAGHQSFFSRDGWQWNVMDALLVGVQIFDLVLDQILVNLAASAGPNMSFMRILRVLRLIRVVRLVRVVRLMSELRSMVSSILGSMKSLFFTLVLIGLLVFIVGVFLTQLVNDTLRSEKTSASASGDLRYFATLDMSCLVLFQSLTGGVDWGLALEPLMEHVSPYVAIVYCLYISFGVLCMLNVVTGVFVESACNSTAEEKEATMVGRLQQFLSSKTTSQTGTICWEEFEETLDDPHMQNYFKAVDLDPSEAKGLFRLLDVHDSGYVEAEEFVMGCLRLRGQAKAVDLATLMYENRRWHRRVDRVVRRLEGGILDIYSKLEDTLD